MALVRGTTTSTSMSPSAGTISTTVTTSGAERFLLIFVMQYVSSGASQPINVTADGAAMTHIQNASPTSTVMVSAFGKIAPTSGTITVSAEFDGYNPYAALVCIPYSGAHQTTPYGTPATNTGSASGNPSVTVPSVVAGEEVLDGMVSVITGAATVTVGAGQTSLAEIEGLGSVFSAGSSVETGSGSVTMSWTTDLTDSFWGTVALAVRPQSGGGGNPPTITAVTPNSGAKHPNVEVLIGTGGANGYEIILTGTNLNGSNPGFTGPAGTSVGFNPALATATQFPIYIGIPASIGAGTKTFTFSTDDGSAQFNFVVTTGTGGRKRTSMRGGFQN